MDSYFQSMWLKWFSNDFVMNKQKELIFATHLGPKSKFTVVSFSRECKENSGKMKYLECNVSSDLFHWLERSCPLYRLPICTVTPYVHVYLVYILVFPTSTCMGFHKQNNDASRRYTILPKIFSVVNEGKTDWDYKKCKPSIYVVNINRIEKKPWVSIRRLKQGSWTRNISKPFLQYGSWFLPMIK